MYLMTSIESIQILNILDCSSAALTKQDIRDPVGRRICRRAQDAAPGRSPPRQSGRGKVPAPGANQIEIGFLALPQQRSVDLQTDSAFLKIDPYAIISLGAAEHQTSVASGTSPTWKADESMEFPVEVPDSEELQLVLKVGIHRSDTFEKKKFRNCIQPFLHALAT